MPASLHAVNALRGGDVATHVTLHPLLPSGTACRKRGR